MLQDIIADVLAVERDCVSDDADFLCDLDADSMRLIEILSRLESSFGVRIAQDEVARMTSLAAVGRILDAALARQR
jgi:acyl carrier protein